MRSAFITGLLTGLITAFVLTAPALGYVVFNHAG